MVERWNQRDARTTTAHHNLFRVTLPSRAQTIEEITMAPEITAGRAALTPAEDRGNPSRMRLALAMSAVLVAALTLEPVGATGMMVRVQG